MARIVIVNISSAEEAFRQALSLNPGNTIARNLLNDAIKRRQFAGVTGSTGATGFGQPWFALLGRAPESEATAALAPKIDTLIESMNTLAAADKICSRRQARGRSGNRLYRRNSYHWIDGHVYLFHHGGRWEPQFNIGFFSAQHWPTNCVRIGVGFNFTLHVMDRNPREGQQRVGAYFAAFQRAVRTRWRLHLITG